MSKNMPLKRKKIYSNWFVNQNPILCIKKKIEHLKFSG